MKFFYADSLDLVDPGFDFVKDAYTHGRIPQRDDVYAHELMHEDPPYDGLLVSRALFRKGAGSGKYTDAQQQRFFREGAQRFLRFPREGGFDPENSPIIGDNGAFSYHKEPEPPHTVEDTVEFYDVCNFTHGVSLDHVILAYSADYDTQLDGVPLPADFIFRYELTMANARKFLAETRAVGARFEPLGAAQGWSPLSYQRAVLELADMGYKRIAVGGLVPLKTRDILAVLDAIKAKTGGKVPLHLLGISRLENFQAFKDAGVVSFDSTSPLRQAFKDARNNYYSDSPKGHYTAIRIPQSDATKMLRLIRSGEVSQEEVFRCERRCLSVVRDYGRREATVDDVLTELRAYNALFANKTKWDAMRRTLADRPWEQCSCSVCVRLGINVVIFRGSNRNRRRGFHNLWWTHQQLQGYREPELSGVFA